MRKRLISALLVVGLFLGMFAVCTKDISIEKQKKLELTWTFKAIPMRGYEGAVAKKPKCFEITAYDKVKYWFSENSFDKKISKEFVKRESKLVSYADTVLERKRDGKEIFLNQAVDGKYINLEEGITYDVLWTGLNRIYKMPGLELYGLFYLYCNENGVVKAEEIDEKKVGEYFSKPQNQYLLDFCVPMIDETIFGEEQAKMVKAAAKSFAVWYAKEFSVKDYEELCKNLETVDKKLLVKEKNKWLKSIGGKGKYTEFSKIFIKQTDCVWEKPDYPSEAADYEVDQKDVIWVWYGRDIKKIGYKKMVQKYIEVEELRKKDFAEAREFLKNYLPQKIGKVFIFCNFHEKKARGSYIHAIKSIMVRRCWENAVAPLLHEYVHFLTFGEGRLLEDVNSDFCKEGLATWLQCFQLKNEVYELSRPYQAELFNEEENGGKRWTADMLEFDKAYSFYEAFMRNKETESVRDQGREVKEGIVFPVDVNLFSYGEWGSILKYVYETYGMEKTIALLKSNVDFEKVLGKTLDELYFETADFVKEEMQKMEAEYKAKASN